MIWKPKSWVGAAEGRPLPMILGGGRRPPPKVILYMTPQIARKTDSHTDSYTGACGVPWVVRWMSPGVPHEEQAYPGPEAISPGEVGFSGPSLSGVGE